MRRIPRRSATPSALAAIILVLLAGGYMAVRSGILVRPSAAALAGLIEVPRYDILAWQAARETEILADYAAASHGLRDPYVAVDPYGMNPLSALAIFETKRPCRIRVAVAGDDARTDFVYDLGAPAIHHEVPILGLYAGRANRVTLRAAYASGPAEEAVLALRTEGLPSDFAAHVLIASRPERMEPGVTLCVACFEQSYTCLLDCRGQVRGYLSRRRMGHGTSMILLRDGNMLGTGDELRQVPYNMASLREFNWLGKIFREYEIPNGVHHDIAELPDGDILAASNSADLFASGTREDEAIVIDRRTGAVLRTYDFRKLLDETRKPYNHFAPDIRNAPNRDWMHLNAVAIDPYDGGLIVSSPIQSMVVKLDPAGRGIEWILGPHEGYGGGSAPLARYLLKAEGPGFEWQWGQHAPVVMPDRDGDPGTLDLLLLDNGQSRSFTEAGALPPAANHSRGVQFRIDERLRSVRRIWQYGEDRGSDCYATFLGSAQYLPLTGNRLLDFGGQPRNKGVPTDDIVPAVFGDAEVDSRIVEATEAGETVFEVAVKANAYTSSAETYRAERLPLFSQSSFDYRLGERRGARLGSSYTCAPATDPAPPLLHAGGLALRFGDLHREGDRLVVDGTLSFHGAAYLLGRAWLVLRSADTVRVYAANSGLAGRFFASIDLSRLPAGVYEFSVAGAARTGNDALSGPLRRGFAATGYRVTVP
jgi:arylsulfate sulfotransferase